MGKRLNRSDLTDIGYICNYYGGLAVVEVEGKYYWAIKNWDGWHWEEIPETLYKELIAFDGDPDKPWEELGEIFDDDDDE